MTNRTNSRPRTGLLAGMLACVLALLMVGATSAHAIDSLTEVRVAYDGMGSSATEFSGATYNADRGVLLTVDDEFNAYEFDLNPDGSIDFGTPVRVLDIAIAASDYEGIAWMSGNRYVLLSEGTGLGYIIDVPTQSNVITNADVVGQFSAGGPDGNTGSEGIAVGPDGSFYVTDEVPSSVSKYNAFGQFIREVALPELGDASGVVVAEDDSLIVTSDESRIAVHYEIDWASGVRNVVDTIDLSQFTQVEGIAMIGNEHLHIFGEQKSGGQTYSHRTGTIIPESVWEQMDVDCSGTSDVVDALLIVKMQVGTSEPIPGCGSGDASGDGSVDIVDSLIITQCDVGIANFACPDA